MKTILLIGIGGVYNYGCEAIVRGTEAIILKEWPNAKIVYASRRPLDDQERLMGSKVQIIERSALGRYSMKNIFRKLLSIMGITWCPVVDSLAMLKNVDVVLSIGGDIYTLSPKGRYPESFLKFGDATMRRGVPYILWGASVGPFSVDPRAEREFTKHLKNISLITAREPATVDYLRTLGVSDNVVPCADPAYVVAPEITTNHTRRHDGLTIGINLSPLSARYRYAGYSFEDFVHAQASAVQHLVRTLNARIVLIPHVICDFMEDDDDLRYLYRLKQAIEPAYQEGVTLLSDDIGFVGTKKKLIKCDLVIAARMHCAINALAAHVPTILVSYSSKAVGMCKYIYGASDWVVSISDFTPDVVVTKVRQMFRERERICDHLAKRIPEVQREASLPMKMLKGIVAREKS